MKKHVWIMNHYAGGMYFDHGGRHYNFAKYLKQAGYEPVVFCANSKHGPAETWFSDNTLWQEHTAEDIAVPFVFVKVRTYTGNGKQRILNMADFYRNVQRAAKEYASGHTKPDIIYASSVHPLTLVAGIRLAKYLGVECVCEVRDLWPESIVEYSRRFTRKHPLVRLLYQGERWIYQKADRLIFTMEGGYDYIREQGWGREIPRSKVFHINNGVDLKTFQYHRENIRVEDPDLENPDIITVAYVGSIRRVNNLGLILDTAKEITDPRIKFLIWGDGDELPILRRRVEEEGIKNVAFKGWVGKKYIPSVISRKDLNLVHWESSDLLRFGVSCNKLFEYLAAARPILSTVHPNYSIVEKYRCGADAEGFTPKDLAAQIQHLLSLPQTELAQMGTNAQAAAEAYDFCNLTETLIQVLEGGTGI